MASLADSQRVVAALEHLNGLHDVASKEMEAAKADAASAKDAYEAAEARLKQVNEAREQDIKDIVQRRQNVALLLNDPLDANPDRVALLEEPLKLRPIPGNVAVVKLMTGPPKVKQESYPAESSITRKPNYASKPIKNTEFESLETCSTIVRRKDGEWFEIRCGQCGANCDGVRDTYIKGVNGLQRHLRGSHSLAMTAQEVVNECTHRTLTKQEAQDIHAGKTAVEKISTRSRSHHKKRDSAAPEVNADTANKPPVWKARTRKRKSVPTPTEAWVTDSEEDPLDQPKQPAKKRKSYKEEPELSPEARERLEEFRAAQTLAGLVDYSDDLPKSEET